MPARTSHIIVLEFYAKKLAFLFLECLESQKFLVSMELLVRRIQSQMESARSTKSTSTRAPSGGTPIGSAR